MAHPPNTGSTDRNRALVRVRSAGAEQDGAGSGVGELSGDGVGAEGVRAGGVRGCGLAGAEVAPGAVGDRPGGEGAAVIGSGGGVALEVGVGPDVARGLKGHGDAAGQGGELLQDAATGAEDGGGAAGVAGVGVADGRAPAGGGGALDEPVDRVVGAGNGYSARGGGGDAVGCVPGVGGAVVAGLVAALAVGVAGAGSSAGGARDELIGVVVALACGGGPDGDAGAVGVSAGVRGGARGASGVAAIAHARPLFVVVTGTVTRYQITD